jgi:hypothetical protein
MIQIIVIGKKDISFIHEPDVNIHDYTSVLNYKSKHNFVYYHSEKKKEEIFQHAITNAPSNITHILFLSTGVLLNDYEYTFEREKTHGMYRDSNSWEDMKVALIKVTPETRKDITNIDDIIVDTFNKNVIDYNPDIGMMSSKLLKMRCEFNKAVSEIRSFKTLLTKKIKPSLFIATSCFNDNVSMHYTTSLIQTIELLKKNQIYTEIQLLPCNNTISEMRNVLVDKFIRGNCTHILLIDHDIQWKPEDVMRLLNNKKELCVGLYPKTSYMDIKTTDDFKKTHYLADFFHNNTMDDNNLMEIKYGGCGFMMIEKKVFNTISKNVSKYNYDGITLANYFSSNVADETYLSEDFAFCKMWRDTGGKCWADLRICLNRTGLHTYCGDPIKSFTVG